MFEQFEGMLVSEAIQKLEIMGFDYEVIEDEFDGQYIEIDCTECDGEECSAVMLAITNGIIEYYEPMGWI